MTLLPLFSRRRRQQSGTVDVYQYETASPKLRAQLVHVIGEAIGDYRGHSYSSADPAPTWDFLHRTMCKELGVFTLGHSPHDNQADFLNWLLNVENIDEFIDGIELSLKMINTFVRDRNPFSMGIAKTDPDEAIEEANARMGEAGFGYRFERNEFIRIDSEFLHSEAVVPTLRLLGDAKYAAANREFREAHTAYRHERYEDCLIGCAKAFESVLKIIAKERRWPVKETDGAKALLDAAYAAAFFAPEVQQGFSSLRSLLESGVPAPRNRSAGHGAGTAHRNVPRRLASFQLHQTAATILYLVECHAKN